jgi:hypothetical protein
VIPAGSAAPDAWATRGVPRASRGVALAGCSAALAVAAHAAAGGSVPSPGLTLVLTVLLAGAGTALADRRRGFPAILAAVGASQLGMHVLLAGLGPDHSAAGHGGAGHGSAVHGGVVPAPVAMVALHVAATVLIAVLLARAENTAFALAAVLRWIAGVVEIGCRPLMPLTPLVSRIRGIPDSNTLVVDILLRRIHARRGPPACC